MNEYLIRLAEAEDIERIQQLSQELMEYERLVQLFGQFDGVYLVDAKNYERDLKTPLLEKYSKKQV